MDLGYVAAMSINHAGYIANNVPVKQKIFKENITFS